MFALIPTLISLLPTIEKYAGLATDLQKLGQAGGGLVSDVEALFGKHQVTATSDGSGGLIFSAPEPGSAAARPEGPGLGANVA